MNRPINKPAWLVMALLTVLLTACEQPTSSTDASTSAAPVVGAGSTADADQADADPSASIGAENADLFELSVAKATAAMEAGELTAEQLARYYLDRIERYNPKLNAVIAVNPDAIEQAKMLDEERAAGRIHGPLHGVPVILKDNIESREAMATTAGSLALKNNFTQRDATVTANLRAAGAVILGKANLSEWANFRSSRSSSGWSGVGGQARNPYDTSKTPCGSSSGSGVSVAADLTLLAVGTETNGSVVCPSSVNGLVGIKPTVGLVSRNGIVPISHRQDTAGPMARSVEDAAAMLNAMVGFDDADVATEKSRQNGGVDRDYTELLKTSALIGKRIGVLRGVAGFHEGVDALFDQAVADIQDAGAQIVDDLEYPDAGDAFDNGNSFNALLIDFKNDLNTYLEGLPNPPAEAVNLEALIAFNKANADQEMPWFQQELFEQAQEKGGFDEDYQLAVEKITTAASNGIDQLLSEHNLDAIIAPTTSAAWSIDRINGDKYLGGSSTYPAVSGYPNITLPMGYVHHLPVGMSFIGTAFDEQELLAMAYAYEQSTNHRHPPKLTSSDSDEASTP